MIVFKANATTLLFFTQFQTETEMGYSITSLFLENG